MIVHTLDVTAASSLVHDLVPTTLHHASAIAGEDWRLDPHRLALVHDTPADDDAWLRLGMIGELLALRGSVVGIEITLHVVDDRVATLHVSALAEASPNAERLAACTSLLSRPFAVGSSRMPGHASARLSTAASVHAARLAWFASAQLLDDVAAIVSSFGDAAPMNASAVAIVYGSSDDATGFVGGGHAVARVCLEAASLGLSASVAVPITRRTWAGVPAASSVLRSYRALVPVEDDAFELAMIWIG